MRGAGRDPPGWAEASWKAFWGKPRALGEESAALAKDSPAEETCVWGGGWTVCTKATAGMHAVGCGSKADREAGGKNLQSTGLGGQRKRQGKAQPADALNARRLVCDRRAPGAASLNCHQPPSAPIREILVGCFISLGFLLLGLLLPIDFTFRPL